MTHASTEYRVLAVDEWGDIHEIDSTSSVRRARQLFQLELQVARMILTVEGMRTKPNGSREFKRLGLVKGLCRSKAQARFLVTDAQWYASGDEPDFRFEQ